MASEFDFWSTVPGLFNTGLDLYSSQQAKREAQARLQAEHPELFNQFAGAASGVLAQAGNADPRAFAAQRFNDQQALLKPLQDAQYNELMRDLYKKGQLGLATYDTAAKDPTGGKDGALQSWQSNGQAVNPQLAAFLVARQTAQAKSAYDAQEQGDKYLNNILARAGMLNQQAQVAQPAARVQDAATKAQYSMTPALLKGAADIVRQNPQLARKVWDVGSGLFGGAADWFGKTFGNNTPLVGSFDSGLDFDWA